MTGSLPVTVDQEFALYTRDLGAYLAKLASRSDAATPTVSELINRVDAAIGAISSAGPDKSPHEIVNLADQAIGAIKATKTFLGEDPNY
ncbi:hypothetical protein GAY28_36175 [Azospirillum brasilense]|nr:hypothetical protein [Azospirillum brasilense]